MNDYVCNMDRKLVGLQFEGSPDQQDAAFSTLAALSVYNRSNKLTNLRELVRRLVDGQLSVRSSPPILFRFNLIFMYDFKAGAILSTERP